MKKVTKEKVRDIKFRAWFISNKYEVMEGQRCSYPEERDLLQFLNDVRAAEIDHGYKSILMQFTGLKDKNGIDIYEGDILRIPATCPYEEITFNCFEVFYHDNDCIGGQNIGFCINRMHPQGNSAGGYGYKFTPNSIRDNGFVIIGNIYENAELLE